MSNDDEHEFPNDPRAKRLVREFRTGEEPGIEMRRPPLLVPTPLPDYLANHAGRHVRVTCHRYDNDPNVIRAFHDSNAPSISWRGAVSLDGLWTVSGVHGGRVRVVPEWDFHLDRFDGGWWAEAERCWVDTLVDDPSPRNGLEGALPRHDMPTHNRSLDPTRPPTRRLRQAGNVDALLAARAVVVPAASDTERISSWGWRVCSEPYAVETILPNTTADTVDDLDRPLTGACVRLCRERDWFHALAHGAVLPVHAMEAWHTTAVFIE
jgi:hypothetical protein